MDLTVSKDKGVHTRSEGPRYLDSKIIEQSIRVLCEICG